MVALLTSVTKNWQTLLEFARTLPPDDGATTTTIDTPPPQRLRQHHTRLTPAQKDEVITLYQQGVLVREICQRYGISKQQVSEPSQSFQPHRRCAPGLCKARGLGWLRGPTAVKRGRRGSRG